jgi:preprotein translocase subunit SecF
MKFSDWYDKNYKKILLIPTILMLLSLLYMGYFYIQNNEIIYKDVSLSGGTTFTISTNFPAREIESKLFEQNFNDFTVKGVWDNSGNQFEVIVTVGEEESDIMKEMLEEILDFKLTENNSSIEFTDSGLSEDFFKQIIIAVILAFFWMACVVFVIFSKGWKTKTWIIIGNIIFAIFLGYFFYEINPLLSGIIFLGFAFIFIKTYIKKSVPAFAVMLSAFADIIMTLAVVNFIGMRLSTAGIVAFLMLIGYSVDTDVLLTTRVLNRRESANKVIYGAFKTGMTMTLTSIIAVAVALIVVYSFQSALNQIFTILLIGLLFDIINTWTTNASIIKWYTETNQ